MWREHTSRPPLPIGKGPWKEPSQGVSFWVILGMLVPAIVCGLIGLWVPAGILAASLTIAMFWISF